MAGKLKTIANELYTDIQDVCATYLSILKKEYLELDTKRPDIIFANKIIRTAYPSLKECRDLFQEASELYSAHNTVMFRAICSMIYNYERILKAEQDIQKYI